MDPQTRKEKHKDQHKKAHGDKYGSQKHVRQMEALREKRGNSALSQSKTPQK